MPTTGVYGVEGVMSSNFVVARSLCYTVPGVRKQPGQRGNARLSTQ